MHFTELQTHFMAYIRDPEAPLPDGVAGKRMQIYRELFFNNVNGFVSSAFPVLKSLYGATAWRELVQAFFTHHDCQTPIFVEIAQEFLLFLQTEYQMKDSDPIFMLELAHYEWLELAVATADSQRSQPLMTQSEVEHCAMSVSDFARIAQYHFDVQHISDEYQPIEPLATPVFFCVYRDENEEVCFLQLNPLSAQVLAYMVQNSAIELTLILDWLTELYPTMAPESLTQGCVQLLKQMAQKGIVRKAVK